MLAELGLNRMRGRVRILTQNPIILKELRSRMRGNRAFVVLTIYLLGMVALIGAVYVPISLSYNTVGGPDLADVGKIVFGMIVLVQVFLVTFIAPAFTAGSISGEKQNQSYDLLRTTLLTPRQLVLGKISSALSYIFLLIFASLPIQSIAFFLGGVTGGEILIGMMLISVTAVTLALIGLYFSTLVKTTMASTVGTYAAAIFLLIGIPFLVLFIVWITDVFGSLPSSLTSTWQFEAIVQYVLMGLASFNLPATIIMSEISLLEYGSYWGYSTSVYASYTASHTIWLPAPWYLYLMWYSLLAVVLYIACVRRIGRTPD